MGCPPLRSEAYTGDGLLAQLNDQGRRFLSESPTRNRIESISPSGIQIRIFHLSPILTAYSTDFGPTLQDLPRALAPYMKGVDSTMLAQRRSIRVTRFDWTLNSQSQARVQGLLPKTKSPAA